MGCVFGAFGILCPLAVSGYTTGAFATAGALEPVRPLSYTLGMKTAVSIPDDVFEAAQRLALRMKKSRSRIFREALKEYVARHAPDQVTEAMDRVCAELGVEGNRFVATASRRILKRIDW